VELLPNLELDLLLGHLSILLYQQQSSAPLPMTSSPVDIFPRTLRNNLSRVLSPGQLMYSLFQIQQIVWREKELDFSYLNFIV
jgi:hypothetical protein